jgi:hypothetical protein
MQKTEIKGRKDDKKGQEFKAILSKLEGSATDFLLCQSYHTGVWLSVTPSDLNGTELFTQAISEMVYTSGIDPLHLICPRLVVALNICRGSTCMLMLKGRNSNSPSQQNKG